MWMITGWDNWPPYGQCTLCRGVQSGQKDRIMLCPSAPHGKFQADPAGPYANPPANSGQPTRPGPGNGRTGNPHWKLYHEWMVGLTLIMKTMLYIRLIFSKTGSIYRPMHPCSGMASGLSDGRADLILRLSRCRVQRRSNCRAICII